MRDYPDGSCFSGNQLICTRPDVMIEIGILADTRGRALWNGMSVQSALARAAAAVTMKVQGRKMVFVFFASLALNILKTCHLDIAHRYRRSSTYARLRTDVRCEPKITAEGT